jgi:hypothetical protein
MMSLFYHYKLQNHLVTLKMTSFRCQPHLNVMSVGSHISVGFLHEGSFTRPLPEADFTLSYPALENKTFFTYEHKRTSLMPNWTHV